MKELFTDTVYWGVILSIGSYLFGQFLCRKCKCTWLNPLLFSTVVTILFLMLFRIDYETYYIKTNCLYYLLTPATVCLAVPLYEQICLLKSNIVAILVGITVGSLSGMLCILLFSVLFRFSHTMYVTILPKSITAAMAMGISEELGGITSLTVPVVIMTGITGNILAESVCKICRIREAIAKGVAIGTASHAMGTARAIEMGKIEGAMSSLAIAVAGIITVIASSFFSLLL